MGTTEKPLGAVLVVGGCGFVGHHLTAQLLESKLCSSVSVMSRHPDTNRLESATYHKGDITSRSDIAEVLSKTRPSVIFHTASPRPIGLSLQLYTEANVDGTRNLLEEARDFGGVRCFVYTSSASVVHDTVSDLVNADETLPLLYMPQQREPYSHTKALADDLVRAANDPKGMRTVSLRPAGIFGEGDPAIITRFAELARQGKANVHIGNGQNLFDYTYVGNVASVHIDAARALMAANPRPESERIDGEAFFVTNDEPCLFWDFPLEVATQVGHPVQAEKIKRIPLWMALSMAFVAEWWVWLTSLGQQSSSMTQTGMRYSALTRTYCIDKVKRRLGYQPTVDIKEGIRRGVQWYLENANKKDR